MINFARAVLLAAVFAGMPPAWADGYPQRPVRLIVPFAPGGGNDFLARLTGQRLSDALGQPFVIDNRAGAGGAIATGLAANAEPDGYTLLLGFIGPMVISPSLGRVPYDAARDFTAISMLAKSHHILVVNPGVAARTVRELIALASANPGKLNYASGGSGTPLHLVAELFNAAAGINIVHVPYRGSGPAAIAVASGETQMVFGNVTSLLPYIRTGLLVALAVTSPERMPLVPAVPTLVESGMTGVDVAAWYALVAPAGMPKATLATLHTVTVSMISTPDYRNQLAGRGFEAVASKPEAFAGFLRAETLKWAAAIKATGIRAN